MLYERFIRTAEWVVLMTPMLVDAAPLDPETLWRRHLEDKRQMTSGPAEEEESVSTPGGDDEESLSISDGISSVSTVEETGEPTSPPKPTGGPQTRDIGPGGPQPVEPTSVRDSPSSTKSLPAVTTPPTPPRDREEQASSRTEESAMSSMTMSTSYSITSAPMSSGMPPQSSWSDSMTASPTSSEIALADGAISATAEAQMGNTADHTKMEIGISAGVVGAFILVGFLIFYYLKKKGKVPVWQMLKRPFTGSRSRSALEPPTIEHQHDRRPPMDAFPSVPPPVIVVTEKRASTAPSVVSPSPSEVERFNSLRRKYTISRTMPERRVPPAALNRRDSSSSTSSRGSVRSIGTNGLPRGPKLPIVPALRFNDPFSDDKAAKDPFADPSAPAPLRFPVKAAVQRPMSRLDSTDESITLTDPRVADSRKLTVANRSARDSLPSPPPEYTRQKSSLIPKPLQIVRGGQSTPMESRFSWTTKGETATPGFPKRESTVTISTDGAPKHRNVNSWVKHQTNRVERHPIEDDVNTPRYAKSERELYDRRSMNSGMDTRRTEYEYDSDY
ncbi:hypothetical protein ABW19_dt0208641 [Dactylella cylindrospora]|nr:hypothetical protein ABW19_dt0208641 [Dactylella cylindrospora]